MAINHSAESNSLLTGVTFSGVEGAPGSTLSWTTVDGFDNTAADIIDVDEDGRLDAGADTFTGASFTGYTVTIGGVDYPIFTDGGGNYAIVMDTATNPSLPASGTSNAYQAESGPNIYLCFAAGTWIDTPEGAQKVETLEIGDLVRTADGRDVPVKWVGRQTMSKLFARERAQLVRIAAGVLGNHSDLFVTGDHGMSVDGLIINASALVNGDDISWVPLSETPDRQTVYHVETEAHDIILANGAASETFLDTPGRQTFDNYAEYIDLYGAEQSIPEIQLPRIATSRLLPDSVKIKLSIGNDAERMDHFDDRLFG